MTTNTFADRFSKAEMSWMNEELPMNIRRQLVDSAIAVMIATSRATPCVCEELLGRCHPAPRVAL